MASRLGFTTSRLRKRSLLSTPSSRKLLEASRAPATLRPTLPCVDSREPGAGGATPGTCCANWSASRSRTGSEAIVSRSITSPTALSPATSVVRSAVTSTRSSTVPASSTMLSVLLTDACRRTSRMSSVLKPTREAATRYVPGARSETTRVPWALVVPRRPMPLSRLVSITVTSGISASVASRTSMARVAVGVWAATGAARPTKRAASTARTEPARRGWINRKNIRTILRRDRV